MIRRPTGPSPPPLNRLLRSLTLLTGLCLPWLPFSSTAQEVLEAFDTGGLETRSAALIFSDQEAGDLSLSAMAIPLPGGSEVGSPTPVAVVVDLEGSSLLQGQEGDSLVTEIYIYAFHEEGGLTDTLTQAFQVDLTSHGDRIRQSGIKFLGHLDLPPGQYSLRLLVLNRKAERLRLEILPVQVPEWNFEEGSLLLPPIFPEDPERWLLVSASAGPQSGPGLPFPMVLEGRPEVPATRPLLAGHRTTPVFLMGRGIPRSLKVEITTEQREAVRELGLGTLETVPGPTAGTEMLAGELSPTELDGGFLLKLSFTLPAQRKKDEPLQSTTWTPLLILPKEVVGEDSTPLWAELRHRAQGGEPTLGMSPEAVAQLRADKLDRRRLESIYRDALQLLAGQRRGEAIQAVRLMEAAELETGSAKEIKLLTESQLGVAEQLRRSSSGYLLPLIQLHEEMYRGYHRGRHFGLSTHSRQMVIHLSEALLQADNSPRARALVACALVSLGGYLQEIGASLSAQKAFDSALEYDPQQEAALLGLGVIHESFGNYEAAVEVLRRYTKHYPNQAEGRLRLALNLQRTGATRRAAPLLQRSMEGDNPRWVRILAYQEWVRQQVLGGDLAAAVKVLQRALELFPEQQRLHVQMASILDRMGRPAEARQALARLDPRAGREQDSPRLRYTQMSQRPLLEARGRLLRAAEQNLAGMSHELSSWMEEGK